MFFNKKRLLPNNGDHFRQGLKLAIINSLIFLVVGGGTFILFRGVTKIKEWGLNLPFPLWLVLLGTSVPCFVFWFIYGKTFGSYLTKARVKSSLALGLLGDMPGIITLFVVVNNLYKPSNLEMFRIVMIMLFMAILMTPVLVVLGALDQKD